MVGRGSGGPMGQFPHLPNRQGGSEPGKGAGGRVGAALGERAPWGWAPPRLQIQTSKPVTKNWGNPGVYF